MGYKSNLKVVLRFVFIIILLSVSVVKSQCPGKCECDANGFEVECSNASLVHLPKGPFHRKMKIMDLSFNRISILKKEMFVNQEIYTLERLIMSNNTITFLEESPFRGLSALEFLDLSNNDIDILKPAIFDDIQRLKTLDLHHNPYLELAENGYDLPHLTDLILNNCKIRTVPSDFFSKLKNLENINLSNNLIENFDSKMISGLTNLQHIDLSSNKLYLLYEVVHQLPISLDSIKLSSNAWACNCEIKEAISLYEKGKYNKSSTILCSSPDELTNETVNEELIKRITCTTTTKETTTESTTEVATADQMVQNDEDPNVEVEKIDDKNSNVGRSGDMKSHDKLSHLPPSESDGDKADDVQQAGWYTNWMIYGAVGLVLTTSIVVIFVKHQVTKHMQRPGNILERSRQDLGVSRDGYHSVDLA